MKIVEILFFNCMTVQAFPVFTFDGSVDHLETPSFASLEDNVHLPENFIVCSSSKEASFDRAGIFSILGEDMSEWLTLVFQIQLGKIKLVVYWDKGFHPAGVLQNPKLDFWYHTCLKMNLSNNEIEFAVNGELFGKVVGQNISNVPRKLKMNIGVDQDNRQFRGSVANIQLFREGDIKEISAAPCKARQGSLLPWNPQVWKVVGSHWLLIRENEEMICVPYKRYNLAISAKITLNESLGICKEKLNNSFIPYPENPSAFLRYVDWHKNTSKGSCPNVWTPLSDEKSEGTFLNMNCNSDAKYQIWDKAEPNGGKEENYVTIKVQSASLQDVAENEFYCSTCSLPSSLLLRLDGVCEDSFIGNLYQILVYYYSLINGCKPRLNLCVNLNKTLKDEINKS